MAKLTQSAREAYNAYQRAYRAKNGQKQYPVSTEKKREYNTRYWEKRAALMQNDIQPDRVDSDVEELKSKVIALREQGYSIRDIAAQLNLSKSKVGRLL